MIAPRLWVDGPHGELFLTSSFDAALAGIYPGGYDDEGRSAAHRMAQREAIACRVATELQALRLLALCDEGLFKPDEESEEILTALFSGRDLPAPLIAWEWLSPRLPLIVTHAAVALRGRDTPTRAGVTVVDSRSARRLVESLAELGLIDFGLL